MEYITAEIVYRVLAFLNLVAMLLWFVAILDLDAEIKKKGMTDNRAFTYVASFFVFALATGIFFYAGFER